MWSMALFICLAALILIISGIILDICGKIKLMGKGPIAFFLMVIPHFILIYYSLINYELALSIKALFVFTVTILFVYIWFKANIFPAAVDKKAKFRIKVLFGGRRIVYYGLYTFLVQIPVSIALVYIMTSHALPTYIIIMDAVCAFLMAFILIVNGMFRIIIASKRLNIVKRIIVLLTSMIPVIGVIPMVYACVIAYQEYDYECFKNIRKDERINSYVCQTKYPLILVHGIGFRDIKYINYWGRIPKELISNGAVVYYGNQEAWGTVEMNAKQVMEKIFEVLKTHNCEKVNIIAHSKGGLDSRYLISKLGMGDYVASLTTISSPHRGAKLVDLLIKWVPDKTYHKIANVVNKYFRMIGDIKPDLYKASRQLSSEWCEGFNKEIIDVEQVYYQSYTSIMKNSRSHWLLSIPYLIVKKLEGENDGLVSVDSSKWGEFKGVFSNKYTRGISHADIIDLTREDYKSFEVIEKYVEIVSKLKAMGF